jgi:hypothetical protein
MSPTFFLIFFDVVLSKYSLNMTCPFFLASIAALVGSTPNVLQPSFLNKLNKVPSLQPISKTFFDLLHYY